MKPKTTIRQMLEEQERIILCPQAAFSSQTKGRLKEEKKCDIRPAFQHDRDKIIHSKSFRRLKHKTQVFLSPSGDHYRTRLTHTLEVSQIARTIAKSLKLNEDLTEAIALGHDLGHTPFGHAGEDVLDKIYPGGFTHVEQSLRVADILEKNGEGLNLTYEVRDGILKHSKGSGQIFNDETDRAATLEGQIVRIADSIAYVNHDIDDALRANIIKKSDLPKEPIEILGKTHAQRIDTMVKNIIFTSLKDNLKIIKMNNEVRQATENLRAYLYENVYNNEITHKEFDKASKILRELYDYYLKNPQEIFENSTLDISDNKLERLVCDFIAGMTDRFALMTYEKLFLPQSWKVI